MIARESDNFPPAQIKELIGQLSIATAKSTDPANKLSLTSSRISMIRGVISEKCERFVLPGMFDLLYNAIIEMISDMKTDNPDSNLAQTLDALEKKLVSAMQEQTEKKSGYMVDESIELIRDYNSVLECRKRWVIANKTYMANHESWGMSNQMLADINDVLTKIELKYNLIIVPKNYSFDINSVGLFNKPSDQ